jgi:hypothetical protein
MPAFEVLGCMYSERNVEHGRAGQGSVTLPVQLTTKCTEHWGLQNLHALKRLGHTSLTITNALLQKGQLHAAGLQHKSQAFVVWIALDWHIRTTTWVHAHHLGAT